MAGVFRGTNFIQNKLKPNDDVARSCDFGRKLNFPLRKDHLDQILAAGVVFELFECV